MLVTHSSWCFKAQSVTFLQKRRNCKLHPEKVRMCHIQQLAQSTQSIHINTAVNNSFDLREMDWLFLEQQEVQRPIPLKKRAQCWHCEAVQSRILILATGLVCPLLLQHKRIQQSTQRGEKESISISALSVFSHAGTWEDGLHTGHFRALQHFDVVYCVKKTQFLFLNCEFCLQKHAQP